MTRLLVLGLGGSSLGLYFWHGSELSDAVGDNLYIFMGVAFVIVTVIALVSES